MKTRIALPSETIYSGLIVNKEEVGEKYGIEIFELEESKCFDLFLANKADAALITPLRYGSGVGKTDSLIIPVSAISINGYTEISSIIFKEELKTFETIATRNPKSYLFNIAKILLAERYDMDPKVIVKDARESELLKLADSVFIEGKSSSTFNSLDIGEEWFDTFEMPLPYAFWICKSYEFPENIGEIIKSIVNIEEKRELEVIEDGLKDLGIPPRQGSIAYDFNKEFEDALAQTLHFLFYHQLIPEIPEIKVLGRKETMIPGHL